MATHDITAQRGGGPPVACALTPADLAAQATGWRQLAAQAMTERTETGYGLRLTFRTQPSVADELRRLAAVENQCCPWATWTVETGAQQIVLDVRSTGDGIITLHTMFTGLDPGRQHPAADERASHARHLNRGPSSMGCCALVSSLAAANPRHISPSAVFDDLWTVRQLGEPGTAVSPARTQAAWRRASVAVA